jgi:hypothetical protein
VVEALVEANQVEQARWAAKQAYQDAVDLLDPQSRGQALVRLMGALARAGEASTE